jgi:hypothetical protein
MPHDDGWQRQRVVGEEVAGWVGAGGDLAMAVLAALGGLAVAGRLLDVAENRVASRTVTRRWMWSTCLIPLPPGQTDSQGHGWITLLRAGVGCYGLQIDAPRFSKVLVVQFRS